LRAGTGADLGYRREGGEQGHGLRIYAGKLGVIAARIESQSRRGRDYVRVAVALTIAAPDVAEALDQP